MYLTLYGDYNLDITITYSKEELNKYGFKKSHITTNYKSI